MKRLISLLLILCLLPIAGGPQATAAGPFADISDEKTQQAAGLLYHLGIVSGTGGANYSPGLLFDRAALAVIGTRLSGVFDVSAHGGIVRFPDVRAGHWAHRWVNAATAPLMDGQPLMVGSTDGLFHPEDPMLYGQLVTVLMKLLGYTDKDVGLNWPYSYIAKAEALGISKDMSFTANHKLTRGEAARLIYNFLFAEAKGGGIYIESPVFGAVSDEVLLVFTVADGKTFLGDYTYHGVLEESLQYKYAKVLIDKDDRILTIEVDESVAYRQVTVKNDRDNRLELTDGTIVPVSSAATVFEWDGAKTKYAERDAFLMEEQVKLAMRDGVLLYILRDSYERQIGAQPISMVLRLQTAGGGLRALDENGMAYPVTGTVNAAQAGQKGVLMIDREHNAISFTPSKDYTYQTATVSSPLRNGFMDSKDAFVSVPGSTTVWDAAGSRQYYLDSPGMFDNSAYLDILPGETLLMAYKDGKLEYIYRAAGRGSGDNYRLAILERQPAKGSDALADVFGEAAKGAVLYKNGFPAELDMLERWDVLMFYENAGVVEACNVRVTGYPAKLDPNPTAPSSFTLLGEPFELLPEATARMGQYGKTRLIYLLSADGRIADVRGSDEGPNTTIGLAKTSSALIGATGFAGTRQIEFMGALSGPYALMTGRVGRIQGGADGRIHITPFEPQSGGKGDLNLDAKTLGSTPVAPWCVLYDQVGSGGRAARVPLSEMPVNRVPASNILYAETGPSGYITAIVLNDMTGDAYDYGFAHVRGDANSYAEVGVSPNGRSAEVREWLFAGSVEPPRQGAVIGLAAGNTISGDGGIVNKIVNCVKHEELTRFDFDGDRSVKIKGSDVPLAAGITVHVPSVGEMSLSDARAYCRTFEVYTDPWGYKARLIVGRP